MLGVLYLHQKNIFYGDMKAPNLLVFRDQRVKLGDLGISVKLNEDDIEGNEPMYYGKGMTEGYVTQHYEQAYKDEDAISKNDLYDCDKYALIKTFEFAATKV